MGMGLLPYIYENHPSPTYNPLGNLGIACIERCQALTGSLSLTENMTSAEYTEKLRNVHVPTLVIAAEHDSLSLPMSHEMNKDIARSRLAILARSKP